MAKILPVFIFLLCYALIQNIISATLCTSSSNILSPCNLIQPETANCSFCDITNEQTQCDSLDAKKYSEWKASQTALVTAWHGQTILNLKNIELKPAGNAKYYLSLEWMFVKPEYGNLTRAFLLHLSCEKEGRCPDDADTCLLVDYLSYLEGDEPVFTAPNISILLGVPYNLTITSLPSNEQTNYTILVPSTPPLEIMNLSHWMPVIAASADPYQQRVSVVFQPAPASLNASGYTVTSSDDRVITPPNITQQTGAIVEDFIGESLSTYTIMLVVYGHANECLSGCNALPGPDMLQVSLMQMPAPVPWGTTSTTGLPPPAITEVTGIEYKPTTEEPKDRTGVYIIIGVILGAVILIALVIIVFILYKRRRRSLDSSMGMQILGKDYNADTDSKIPSVLILYSYDCPAHEQVVIEFSNFLRSEWRLEVYFDLWEQKDIAERGYNQWLQEKLIRSQFIIVVSSTGARIKCARNRQSKMKYDRDMPDMFCDAVDMVLQRSHANRHEMAAANLNSQPTFTCLVVSFPYSCENDIPPKLDTWERFSLMKDLYELYCKLSCAQQDQLPSKFPAVSPSKYKTTRLGKQLSQVLQKAIDFFDNNRDWVAERLEPVSPPMVPTENQKQPSVDEKRDESQPDPHAQPVNKENGQNHGHQGNNNLHKPVHESAGHSRMSSTISSAAEEDALLLEERRKKRQIEEEQKMEKVSSSYQPLTEFHKVDMVDGKVWMNNSSATSSTPPVPPMVGSSPRSNNTKVEDSVRMYPNGEGQHQGGTLPIPVPSSIVGESNSIHNHSQSNSQYSSLSRSYNRGQPHPETDLLTNGVSEDPQVMNGNFEEELQRDIAFILNDQTGLQTQPVEDNTYLWSKGEYPSSLPLEFLQVNDHTNLSFSNPMYCKMNGEAGKAGLYGSSDRNENFIIDLGNPQEALDYFTQPANVQRQFSTNSERGTDL